MSRIHSHIQSAVTILKLYNGSEPFSAFLKKYFADNRKFGSTDRKKISHICYSFFRLGKAWHNMPVEKRIMAALFLCSTTPNEYLAELNPALNGQITLGVKVKAESLHLFSEKAEILKAADVFPWLDELSTGIDPAEFIFSHFIQPDLFIRIRPGRRETVIDKLQKSNTEFTEVEENCLSFPNQTKIDKLLETDEDVVIQDLSSQRTGDILKFKVESRKGKVNMKVWDCCAGSGGKSIMVYDIFPRIELSVSDIRESILSILKKRFVAAGLGNYKSFVLDLSRSNAKFNIPEGYRDSTFDLVIADLPCTGSGTWGRTPEQLFYFQPSKIEDYAARQEMILSNVIPFLKPGGYLFYITCSVFRKENEDRAKQIIDSGMVCLETKLFSGYNERADTMFAALFHKPIA